MKLIYTFIAFACLATAWIALTTESSHVNAQQQPPGQRAPRDPDEQTELSKFMRKKLASSNQILEGLVTDDMTQVEKGADELLKMSDAEHWRASNDMMYLHHSRVFRNSVDLMRDKAEKRSIDGVALAWMDVTMSCIKCHEWVRDTLIADVPLDAAAVPGTSRFDATRKAGDNR